MKNQLFETALRETADLAKIESDLHHEFDVLDEAMNMAKMNRGMRAKMAARILKIFERGLELGAAGVDPDEWVGKYKGYGIAA